LFHVTLKTGNETVENAKAVNVDKSIDHGSWQGCDAIKNVELTSEGAEALSFALAIEGYAGRWFGHHFALN
jgi:hypothetical protein